MKSLKNFIPAIAWGILILVLSSGPGIPLPSKWWDLFSPDKLGHAFVYGVLVILTLRAFQNQGQWSSRILWGTVIGSAVYGILMEVMQWAFFPGRYFEVLDIIANIIGAIVGWFIYAKYFIIKT